MPRYRLLVLGAALGAALACKTTEPAPVPVRLALVVAPPSTAQSGVALTPQPVLEVQDGSGNAVAVQGRQVVAVLASQGGTLTGTLEATTNAQGRAAFANLGLSGPAGVRTIRFDSPGLSSASADPITVGAGTAATLTAAGGNFQTAPAGTSVAVAPAVLITDQFNNPVANAPVTFAVASGGGSIVAGSTTTNGSGVATLGGWTLGTAVGLNTLTATSSAVPSVSVTFTATGILGAPAILTLVAGDAQSATVGGATPVAPSAKLTDAFGNSVPGVIVTFAAASGGGSVTGGAATTNAQGVATVGRWTLGLPPGANTLTAARAGVSSVTYHATGIDFPVSALDAGDHHSCALAPGGQAYCWGLNASGQLGNGTLLDDSLPIPVGGGLVFTAISTAIAHTCGLVGSGDAWCWGDNSSGQLGDGSGLNQPLPVQVTGGLKFTSIVTGQFHTCALQANGAAFCWGAGASGRLGDGTQTNRLAPTAVAGGHLFTMLSAGPSHTCGVATDGTLFCWGANANGRLGDGTTTNRTSPTPVSGTLKFLGVSTGGTFSCGIATGGLGYCWGNGASGFLGTGSVTSQLVPTPVSGGLVFTAISSAAAHSCALVAAGQAYCWGLNASGELGDGTGTSRLVPTAVLGGLTFSTIREGSEHTCARATSGGAYCWGRNDTGALGDGTTLLRASPVGVVKP
jgi:alpha-tubulin suppressor-like RCC1 family protein